MKETTRINSYKVINPALTGYEHYQTKRKSFGKRTEAYNKYHLSRFKPLAAVASDSAERKEAR